MKPGIRSRRELATYAKIGENVNQAEKMAALERKQPLHWKYFALVAVLAVGVALGLTWLFNGLGW